VVAVLLVLAVTDGTCPEEATVWIGFPEGSHCNRHFDDQQMSAISR
jgi:hypothetical protein